ncbi:hypothetical protein GWC95_13630 [Sediminibacterium roseum]|uniref:SGNH hydrolase-type esterase domain-containing protein n=1 Tax=Sediminibacterium roseum TaxID=1978412 RepID=A0ABW9ZUZ6_9BACT|nr:GDSL-type esterase/lipase family protein [Sediminibacterium roseum]NCI50969.1 hypothetical protein [Sediminibacterium roseum]
MKKQVWIKMMLLLAVLTQLPSCSVSKSAIGQKLRNGFTVLGYGDSITEGSAEFSSYLFPLDSMLKAAGFKPTFIGPRRSQRGGIAIDHFGYGGRNAEYLAARVDSVYGLYPADLVLLHAGHNHFVEEAPVKGIVNAQRNIIQTIRKKNPASVIIVAAVITSGKLPKYEYIPDLNIAIKAMVDSLNDNHVVFVDQSANWDWMQYTISDKVHPNRAGANRIAANWFDAIVKISREKL